MVNFFNLICSKNILTKLVGYQQSRCQDEIRGWIHFAFMWIVFTFVELFSFMLGPTQSCTGNGVSFLYVQCCGSCMVGTEYST